MKTIKLNLFLLASILLFAGCGTEENKASMDAETEKELIAQYGNPVVITVKEPGTLQLMFEESETNWGETRFLRLAGNLNGTDIAALNSQLESSSVNALDMLDVNIVEGGEPYYDFGGNTLYTENNVIGKEFITKGYVQQLFLPLSAKEIQEQALSYCEHLTYVKLPDGLEKIGHNPFPSGVKTINIPRSVKYLDKEGIGEFEDIYMEWTAEDLANFQDYNVQWLLFESEGRRSTFTFKRPTLHVPAGTEAAYEATFKGFGKIVAAGNEATKKDENVEEETIEDAKAEGVLNKSLVGLWVNNDEASVMLELSDTYKTFDAGKGYGYVLAANEYYEYDFKLVFTSISPDGDNIKVKYDEIESYFEGDGDPDSYDEYAGEWKERKVGSGELTLQPQGSKLKIISSKKRISNKVLRRN